MGEGKAYNKDYEILIQPKHVLKLRFGIMGQEWGMGVQQMVENRANIWGIHLWRWWGMDDMFIEKEEEGKSFGCDS